MLRQRAWMQERRAEQALCLPGVSGPPHRQRNASARARTFAVAVGRDRSRDQFGFASLAPTVARQASADHALAPRIWAGVLDDTADGHARPRGIHPFFRGSSGSYRLTAADAAHCHGSTRHGHHLVKHPAPISRALPICGTGTVPRAVFVSLVAALTIQSK